MFPPYPPAFIEWMEVNTASGTEEATPMSLPEAATAALSQWNKNSSPLLTSLRNLPQPTREQVVDVFNEEDTTNLFYAYLQPPLRLLGAGDDDPNHPWGKDPGAPDLAAGAHKRSDESINEATHPTLKKYGWKVSPHTQATSGQTQYTHPEFPGHTIDTNNSNKWSHQSDNDDTEANNRTHGSLAGHLAAFHGTAHLFKNEAIVNPNSSGQGYDPDHQHNPHHLTMLNHGYKYSHTTPVRFSASKQGPTTVMHHTYKHTSLKDHNASVYRSPNTGVHRWETSKGGSGHATSGVGDEELNKHLMGHVARAKRSQKEGIEETSSHQQYLHAHGWKLNNSGVTPSGVRVAPDNDNDNPKYTHSAHPGHVINTYADKSWNHIGGSGKQYGTHAGSLGTHLDNFHRKGESCYESTLPSMQVYKHRVVLETLCPEMTEAEFATFQENPKGYFTGHGWQYVTDTPNGSMFRHPRFHGNDIIINSKSGQWEHMARGNRVATGQSFDDFRKYASPRFQMRMETVGESILPDAPMVQVLARYGYTHQKSTKAAQLFTKGESRLHVFNSGAGGWLHDRNGNTKHGAGAEQLQAHMSKIRESVNEWGDGSRPGDSPVMASIRHGHRVTIKNRFGQHSTGKAVMRGPAGWVLNMGGAHGTPAIAHDDNIVKVHVPKTKKEDMEEDHDHSTYHGAFKQHGWSENGHNSKGKIWGIWNHQSHPGHKIHVSHGGTRWRHQANGKMAASGKDAASMRSHLGMFHSKMKESTNEDWQYTRPIMWKRAATDLYRPIVPTRPELENVETAYGSILSQLTVLIATVPSQSEAATLKRLYTELAEVQRAIADMRAMRGNGGDQNEGGAPFMAILASVRAAVGDGDDFDMPDDMWGSTSRKMLALPAGESFNESFDDGGVGDVAKKHGYVPSHPDQGPTIYHHPTTHSEVIPVGHPGRWLHFPSQGDHTGYKGGSTPHDLDAHLSQFHKKGESVAEGRRKPFEMDPEIHAGLHRDFHTLSSDHVQRVVDMAKKAGYRKPKNANGSTGRYFYAQLQRKAHHEALQARADHVVDELMTNNPVYQGWEPIDRTDKPAGAKVMGDEPTTMGEPILTGFTDEDFLEGSVDEAEGEFSRVARAYVYKRTKAGSPHGTGKSGGQTYANWHHPAGYDLHHHGENWHHFAPGHDDPKHLSTPGQTHKAAPIGTGKGSWSLHAHLAKVHRSETGWESRKREPEHPNYVIARQMGHNAHKAGVKAVPAADRHVIGLIGSVPGFKHAHGVLDAWNKGWHARNASSRSWGDNSDESFTESRTQALTKHGWKPKSAGMSHHFVHDKFPHHTIVKDQAGTTWRHRMHYDPEPAQILHSGKDRKDLNAYLDRFHGKWGESFTELDTNNPDYQDWDHIDDTDKPDGAKVLGDDPVQLGAAILTGFESWQKDLTQHIQVREGGFAGISPFTGKNLTGIMPTEEAAHARLKKLVAIMDRSRTKAEAADPVTRMLSVAEQHGYQQNKKHPSIWEHPDGRRIRESNGEWVHESPKIVKEGAHEQRAITGRKILGKSRRP